MLSANGIENDTLYIYVYCIHTLYILIGWQACRGDKNTSETLLSITRKSNTGKIIRHLPAYIHTKHS